MSLATVIYLASLCNALIGVFLVISVVISISFFGHIYEYHQSESKEEKEKRAKYATINLWTALVFILLFVVTPTKETVYMMIGASVAQDAYHSDVGQKVMTLINQKLDEEIKKQIKEAKE